MADKGHEETEDVLKRLEKEISKEYAKAEKEIAEKLDDYLRRFKIKDELKKQAVINGQITQEEYEQWRLGQVAIGKRWEEMRDSIAQDLANTAQIAKSVTNEHMPEVYAINHNYGTFQVEKESHVDTSYTLYDRQAVEAIFKEEHDLYHRPGWRTQRNINMGKQLAWDKKQVQSVMTQALLQGESIGKIATRLSKKVGESDRKAAIRNARTMTTGIQNAGRVDSYKRAEGIGIKLQQEWLATLDNRTRHEHRVLDGQRVPVGEKFEVDGYEIEYPGDPTAEAFLVYNCRCTLVPVLKGYEGDNSWKDEALKDMTYDEWVNGHVISDPITKQDDTEKTMKRLYGKEYAELASKGGYDPMGATEKLHIPDRKTVKLYHNDENSNVWTQTNSINAQNMKKYIEQNLGDNGYGKLDRVVIMKHETLGGISAYDHTTNILYIAEELIDESKFKQIVDSTYFAADSLDGVIKHELGGHKKHWDSIKEYYMANKERFNTITDAKKAMEEELRKYVKNQMYYDPLYIEKNVSINADEAFSENNLNELIADVIVKDEKLSDTVLNRLVREVLSHDGLTE